MRRDAEQWYLKNLQTYHYLLDIFHFEENLFNMY